MKVGVWFGFGVGVTMGVWVGVGWSPLLVGAGVELEVGPEFGFVGVDVG